MMPTVITVSTANTTKNVTSSSTDIIVASSGDTVNINAGYSNDTIDASNATGNTTFSILGTAATANTHDYIFGSKYTNTVSIVGSYNSYLGTYGVVTISGARHYTIDNITVNGSYNNFTTYAAATYSVVGGGHNHFSIGMQRLTGATTINGQNSSGYDTIIGGNLSSTTIYEGGGHNSICLTLSGVGSNYISAGSGGYDTITASNFGHDTVIGSISGHDIINVSGNCNLVTTTASSEVINVNGGVTVNGSGTVIHGGTVPGCISDNITVNGINSNIYSSVSGHDTITSTGTNNKVYGDNEKIYVSGSVVANGNNDTIYDNSVAGKDTITANGNYSGYLIYGNTSTVAGSGADVINVTGSNSTVNGSGAGNDTITVIGTGNTVNGTHETINDTGSVSVYGNNDTINASTAGQDTITATGTGNNVYGHLHMDSISVTDNSTVHGSTGGQDTITAGNSCTLYTSSLNGDSITASGDHNTIYDSGAGQDTITVNGTSNIIHITNNYFATNIDTINVTGSLILTGFAVVHAFGTSDNVTRINTSGNSVYVTGNVAVTGNSVSIYGSDQGQDTITYNNNAYTYSYASNVIYGNTDITTGVGSDSITANANYVSIYGSAAGQDTIASYGLHNTISGSMVFGEGYDVFNINGSYTTVNGSLGGHDTISCLGSTLSQGNLFYGSTDMTAGSGADLIQVNRDAYSVIHGSAAGQDTINAGCNNYVVVLETIYGGTSTENGSGNDSITVNGYRTEVHGSVAGQDTITINGNNDVVYGSTNTEDGSGSDVITVNGVNGGNINPCGFSTVHGSAAGFDTITVSGNNDVVYGSTNNGSDLVSVTGNNAAVYGSVTGQDTITVNGNGNVINVSADVLGTDSVSGSVGTNSIKLTTEATYLTDDSFQSVTGIAKLFLSDFANQTVTIGDNAHNAGITSVDGSAVTSGTLTIDASAYTSSISLKGGMGANTLLGGSGNDCIVGGNSNTNLIDGGNGNDTLAGGQNAVNQFQFDAGYAGQTTITNFTLGKDTIIDHVSDPDALVISYTGGNAVVDFGSGNKVTLTGITSGLVVGTDILVS